MVNKEDAERIYGKCRNVQGSLYHQIERVEHSINLLRYEKPSLIGRLIGSKHTEKIMNLISRLNFYKTELHAHADFVGVKLSVLEKEIKKPETTVEQLEEISNKLYEGVKTIEMPKELREELATHKIVFGKEDVVDLTGNKQLQKQEQERDFE